MLIMNKKEVHHNNKTKREAFNTVLGDLMSISSSSPSFHNISPPKSNRRSGEVPSKPMRWYVVNECSATADLYG